MSTATASVGFEVGERLRSVREAYGLSQRVLAKRSGVANGLISMIELNRTSPSVATLKKILDGIPLTLADFFTGNVPSNEEPVVYRAPELVEIGSGGISYRQVGRNLRRRAIQLLHERLERGSDTGTDMLRHEAEEGGVVVRGKLELTVGHQSYVLGPGDAYYFDSRLPHRFRNVGDDVCEVVSACTPPSF
ncbi:MAG: cupin domain-containing protein [Vicinamibacteria bacterium]